MFVKEQHRARADAHHVIMKGAGVDGLARLANMNRAVRLQTMTALNSFARLQGLPRRVFARPGFKGVAAMHENLDALTAMLGAQAHMIGRPLIGEGGLIGQRVMDSEPAWIGKDRGQGPPGLLALDRAVQRRQKVRRRKMQTSI